MVSRAQDYLLGDTIRVRGASIGLLVGLMVMLAKQTDGRGSDGHKVIISQIGEFG